MSQTAIPLEFERYLQNQISLGDAPDMNEMIFAYIPGLDASLPIDRSNGLPDVSLWVHQQDIDQVGKLGDNALAYSVVIPGTVAEFTFNAIYLRDKNVPNSCGMVVHKAEETKENGMASTKSLVQAYAGAAEIAGITVDAATWQIDYQARLNGMEEDHRLACLDNYGHTAFVEGFDVTQQADPNKYQVTPGIVYVGGLRGVLTSEVLQTITTKPNGLYVDVVRQGTALSVWENIVTITASQTELTDYVDGNGDQHYVAKLAGINADGSVVDWRVKGGLDNIEALVKPIMNAYGLSGKAPTAAEFGISSKDLNDITEDCQHLTLTGEWKNTPWGDDVGITGQLTVYRRYFDAGAAVVQLLHAQDGQIYHRMGSGVPITFPESWNKLLFASDAQDLPYDPNRTYKQNESCVGFDDVTGEMTRYISYYPGENKGHDPQDPANRHEAWANFPTPCWWIKAHGLEPGTPTYWPSNDIPENAMQVMDLDIDAAFYHRIAKAHPSLVADGKINLATLLGRYIRIADGVNHLVNATHEDAIRNITGSINTLHGTAVTTADGVLEVTKLGSSTAASGSSGSVLQVGIDASLQVPTADQNQPVTTMQNYIIWM